MFALIMSIVVLAPSERDLMLSLSLPEALHCHCVCVDGLVKTQCLSMEAARREPAACALPLRCAVPGADRRLGVPLDADSTLPGERDCREVRVWREAWRDYDGVRVCDVRYGMRHNAPPSSAFGRFFSVQRDAYRGRYTTERDYPGMG